MHVAGKNASYMNLVWKHYLMIFSLCSYYITEGIMMSWTEGERDTCSNQISTYLSKDRLLFMLRTGTKDNLV